MGLGALNAARGEREGDIVRLYSDFVNGECAELTLYEPEGGQAQIVSYQTKRFGES